MIFEPKIRCTVVHVMREPDTIKRIKTMNQFVTNVSMARMLQLGRGSKRMKIKITVNLGCIFANEIRLTKRKKNPGNVQVLNLAFFLWRFLVNLGKFPCYLLHFGTKIYHLHISSNFPWFSFVFPYFWPMSRLPLRIAWIPQRCFNFSNRCIQQQPFSMPSSRRKKLATNQLVKFGFFFVIESSRGLFWGFGWKVSGLVLFSGRS